MQRYINLKIIIVLTTRNVLSKQNQSEIFRTQEKNEEPNVKLIDIEAFLLKVTSKRQAITPSSDLARNAHLSYVPPCVIQKVIPCAVLFHAINMNFCVLKIDLLSNESYPKAVSHNN